MSLFPDADTSLDDIDWEDVFHSSNHDPSEPASQAQLGLYVSLSDDIPTQTEEQGYELVQAAVDAGDLTRTAQGYTVADATPSTTSNPTPTLTPRTMMNPIVLYRIVSILARSALRCPGRRF